MGETSYCMDALKQAGTALGSRVQRSAWSTKASRLQRKKSFHGFKQHKQFLFTAHLLACCQPICICFSSLFLCLLSSLPLRSHFKHWQHDLAFAKENCSPGHSYWFLHGLSRWTPSHEKAHTDFSLKWRGFLTLSHIMHLLPTLSLSLYHCGSFLFCTVSHTHSHTHRRELQCFATTRAFKPYHHNHWHLQRVFFYW